MKEQKRLSYREIARLSGGLVSHGTVSDVVSGRSKDIKLETLKGLAKGLGVPEEEVFQVAFGEDAGHMVATEEALVNSLPFQFQKLSAKDREALMPIFQMLAREMSERVRRSETDS